MKTRKLGEIMFEKLKRQKREYAREYVIRVLRHNIINFNLKPGQLVSENEIAEILGISRTPVREAFIELSRASLVEIYPQKGTCISPIDMNVVEESRFMRCAVEKAVVQLCCDVLSDADIAYLEENLQQQDSCVRHQDYKNLLSFDDSFHEYLFKACGKKMIYSLIKSVMAQFDRVRILNLAEMNMEITVKEHKQILQAIKNKDKQISANVMEKHLTRVIFDMSYLKKKHPEYFKRDSLKLLTKE
ncbi:MAG: GntR family transcriptional regulator [Tepidanaerobacteraceae bacterium]|jgi:DNA-binding GntR family transcriptional regulator